MNNIAIIIPARYGSTRFPGKPLAEIGGKSMITRVIDAARTSKADVYVATDNARIADHVRAYNCDVLMTSEDCKTGSDRVLDALDQLDKTPDFVLNLQGDAPFTPPHVIGSIITAWQDHPEADVVTPIHALSWGDLDRLRENKKITPFSGTCAVTDQSGKALWFSKNIIPALRKEDDLRAVSDTSPVCQHIGLYGYKPDALRRFAQLPEGQYEKLEGLEQLRFLENHMYIQCVRVDIKNGFIHAGIDTPEDLARAEALIKT